MDTSALKKFAQAARNLLIDQVTGKLDMVLAESSAARRESPQAVKDLESQINRTDRGQVIEKVAYTWFNRFSALRFMDANNLTDIGVVSPADGQTRPEILAEAAAGQIGDTVPADVREAVTALLDGRRASIDAQGEAYRLLLVATCNHWYKAMPFLFEKIADYTELLMPEDLLSQTSILAQMRTVMNTDACQDVEIIGWLYQFYISEKKDEVFAGLKKNQKITAENIPAATQLFTPHWIVRYLVENSLGRLWLLNRPQSRLAEQMDYYIAPEEPETDFLRITRPEEIRICDPAAGSGHMLTYAFDLLYAIYEEEGYDATEIPALILTHNLTGVEIDDRAGALAAFALAMKAAAKLGRRRFLRMEAKPDICVLQNVAFTEAEMQDVAAVVGKDLFTDELRETLGQFEQAKNFGSLIVPKLRDPAEALRVVEARDFGGDLLLKEVQERVVAVLRMAEALSPKYHVVVANPPYAGAKGYNSSLSKFAIEEYKDFRSDLFSMFIKRISLMTMDNGQVGLMTPFTWMFISSFERLRTEILENFFIRTLVQPEYHSFFESAFVPICAFVISKQSSSRSKGRFFDLGEFYGADAQPLRLLEAIHQPTVKWSHYASTEDFEKIPGKAIAYWLSNTSLELFASRRNVAEHADIRQGLITGDNNRFLRQWYEVAGNRMAYPEAHDEIDSTTKGWFPLHKGGAFRRWYGNHDYVIDWENDGSRIRNFVDQNGKLRSRPQNLKYFFQPAVTWTELTIGPISGRVSGSGFVYDATGPIASPHQEHEIDLLAAVINSKATPVFLKVLAPTMHYSQGPVGNIPWPDLSLRVASVSQAASYLTALSRSDWDAYESSWDFTTLPLLQPDHRAETLEATYTTLRTHWQGMTDEMLTLEEENNRIFIDAYGLQDELTPEVPLNEITLTSNPAYRYGIKNDVAANETRLRADTMAEFLSYAVGCMFGRYSLDAPGLILANQGETLKDYLARVPEPSFMPDEDNVIPVLDGDWFADDITDRFRLFLRTTFGEAHFRENLKYIEDALGKDIRKYLTKDFYADHVKRYKKRPIYWMFSSPKGSFNALIYMHRYRADTVSVLLNDYLREYRSKLEGYRAEQERLSDSPDASQSVKTKALREIDRVGKAIDELEEWERDVIYPLATQKIEIDLDDGVKANYPLFGTALKKIPGLS